MQPTSRITPRCQGSPKAALALLMFNVGVEIGQSLFVGAILLLWLVLFLQRLLSDWPMWLRQLPAYGIAALWMIERIAGF